MSTSLVPSFKSYLEAVEPTVAQVASSFVTPKRITSLLLSEAAKNPELYKTVETQAGRNSIASFFMLAEQTGLEPGSALGLIYATPRRNKAKEMTILPIIGYKGYCELARRSGEIKRINAKVFYADELERGLVVVEEEPPDVRHKWSPDVVKTDETIMGAYAVVEMKDGGKATLVLSRSEIITRAKRGGSFSRDISPWSSDFGAMCRKTVLRALLMGGTVPLSAEAKIAIANDPENPANDPDDPPITVSIVQPDGGGDGGSSQQKTGTQRLRRALEMGPGGSLPEEGESNPFSGNGGDAGLET